MEETHQTSGTTKSSEESEYNKRGDIWGESTSYLPYAEEYIGSTQDGLSSVDFRKRRQEERTDHISQQIDTDGHGSHNGLVIVEFDHEFGNARRENRRGKRRQERDGSQQTDQQPFLPHGKVEGHLWIVLTFPSYNSFIEVRDGQQFIAQTFPVSLAATADNAQDARGLAPNACASLYPDSLYKVRGVNSTGQKP
jgi:hypothetical protein